MHRTPLVLTALCLSLAALARYDAPAFGVPEGAELEKSFETRMGFFMEDAVVSMNGEDTDITQMGLPEDLELTAAYELACSDTYESMGDERPLVLVRAFDTIRMSYEDQSGEGGEEGPEELVGKTVRFAWNAEDEAYDKSFVGEEGDEEDLDDLAEDLDLRRLLPDGDVAEGDTWSADGVVLLELWMPGFDVRARLTEGDLGEAPPEIAEMLLGLVDELALECTYEGTVEEDGVALGLIALAATVEEVLPLPTELFEDDEEEGPDIAWDHLDVTIDLAFEGTVSWNLTEGRFESFEGTGEGNFELDLALAIEDFGLEIEGRLEFSMELEQSATVRAAG